MYLKCMRRTYRLANNEYNSTTVHAFGWTVNNRRCQNSPRFTIGYIFLTEYKYICVCDSTTIYDKARLKTNL